MPITIRRAITHAIHAMRFGASGARWAPVIDETRAAIRVPARPPLACRRWIRSRFLSPAAGALCARLTGMYRIRRTLSRVASTLVVSSDLKRPASQSRSKSAAAVAARLKRLTTLNYAMSQRVDIPHTVNEHHLCACLHKGHFTLGLPRKRRRCKGLCACSCLFCMSGRARPRKKVVAQRSFRRNSLAPPLPPAATAVSPRSRTACVLQQPAPAAGAAARHDARVFAASGKGRGVCAWWRAVRRAPRARTRRRGCCAERVRRGRALPGLVRAARKARRHCRARAAAALGAPRHAAVAAAACTRGHVCAEQKRGGAQCAGSR